MTLPKDPAARKYYRVAMQRLEDARLILEKIDRPAAATYLAGYAIECILKALLLATTPAVNRKTMHKSLKDDFGHNLRALRAGVVRRHIVIPRDVARELVFVSSWSPDLRYQPGPGNRREAERFLKAAKVVLVWADGRI